ncbi:hypothetical protein [Bifidobacterium oedipodis]|nr:hypothetical protein [Bifidobacterium sp. DSM 109957]
MASITNAIGIYPHEIIGSAERFIERDEQAQFAKAALYDEDKYLEKDFSD